jgi:hypothetical protein
MAAIPTLEEEDAKRPNREREQLVGRRTGVVNRMKAALVRLGIRSFNPKLRMAPQQLATPRTPEGGVIPPNTLAELQREMSISASSMSTSGKSKAHKHRDTRNGRSGLAPVSWRGESLESCYLI